MVEKCIMYNINKNYEDGYDDNTQVNAKGKGKDKEIPKDKENPNEIYKESLDSCAMLKH
jgi:hypothetical protein